MSDILIPRRTFLRGVGTLMALPMLEAMLPLNALAQSASKSRINRMAFLFVPNGMHMPAWTPTETGPNWTLPQTMQPLKNVKDSLTVLTGLTQNGARALGDGGGDHARSSAAFLTGCHPKKTDGADISNGMSADQLAAMKIGHKTQYPSLEIGCERGAQAGNCDTGYSCAYSSSISWRSATTPAAHEVDPRAVFERLFGNGDPNESAESRARRVQAKRSILDFVMEDANSLKGKLGSRDQVKLNEYFEGVREIEQRLARMEKQNLQARISPKDAPTGTVTSYAEHLRLLADMMVLAFQSDQTRICTFMFANDGSNRSYKEIGVPEGHHDCSHHGGDAAKQAKVQQINTFHVSTLGYLLEKMQSIQEPEGTLLDNSMVLYGAGISDGDRHDHDNLPLLLAGKGAGTIKSGRHIAYANETPMTNLFLNMLDRMGVPADHIGDSTGRLDSLINPPFDILCWQ